MVGGLLAAQAHAGFLGGLIAGFLAGYVVLFLRKLFSRLPHTLEGIKPVLLYPVFGMLITGLIMIFVINGPVTAVNTGLTNWLQGLSGTNAILLGLILGGMMAVDMGGPLNKAASLSDLQLLKLIVSGLMLPSWQVEWYLLSGLPLQLHSLKANSVKRKGNLDSQIISWVLHSLQKGPFLLRRRIHCALSSAV